MYNLSQIFYSLLIESLLQVKKQNITINHIYDYHILYNILLIFNNIISKMLKIVFSDIFLLLNSFNNISESIESAISKKCDEKH